MKRIIVELLMRCMHSYIANRNVLHCFSETVSVDSQVSQILWQ